MILIKNGTLYTMEDGIKENCDILLQDGKIAEIGRDIKTPDGCTIIDAKGKRVMPGFVDPHCHIGLWEWGMGFEGADGNEAFNPVTPELRALDGINPVDKSFELARNHGVTTVVTGPGSANVIGGQFAAIKTVGCRIDDMIIKCPSALKVAFGENPKKVYSGQKKSPSTRMATAAILRENLIKAQDYKKKLAKGEIDPDKMPDRDLKMEILVKVLDGEIPLKCHAHRADDILTAIRICNEFDLQYSLDHCTEGYMIADILAAEGSNVIIGPLLGEASKVELRNMTFASAGILSKAGVKAAMMTDHPVTPSMYLPMCAALAVREGQDEMEALKSITIYAAKVNFIDDRVGSLKVSKDADVAIYDGNPLEIMVTPEIVIIDGNVVFNTK